MLSVANKYILLSVMLLSDVMMSIVMLCDIVSSVVIPSFILLNVAIPSVVMLNVIMLSVTLLSIIIPGNTKGDHCTVDLLFDLFGFVCFAIKNKNC
jgi:hypothetical protein